MNLYQFFDKHWFLAFCFGYGLLGAIAIITHLIVRGFRTIVILIRGWPPPHLDADGDWKPEKKDEN